MPPLKIIDSTFSSPELGHYIRKQYGLSDKQTCKLLRKGINDTYLISDPRRKYIFRLYHCNWRTKREIQEELKLLNFLSSKDIPVSYPIKSSNQSFIQEIKAPEGKRYGVLFSYAPGNTSPNLSLQNCKDIGKILGMMHRATENIALKRVTYNFKTMVKEPMKYIRQFIPAQSKELQSLKKIQGFLQKEFSNTQEKSLRKGCIHFDFAYNNLHIDKNGKPIIFDFDFCGNGWLCNDVAYFKLVLFLTNKEESAFLEKSESFLQGYESIKELTKEEKRLLDILGTAHLIFYLGVQCQRYETWSNRFLTDTYLKHFVNNQVVKYHERYSAL